MNASPTYPFPDDLKSELMDDIAEVGADYATGTLDSLLLEANGSFVSSGVTKEMYEGQVISALTAADMIAVSLGQSAVLVDAELQETMANAAEDIQQTEGAADLAIRALSLIADPENETFGDCTAELPTRDDLLALINPLLDTLGTAKLEYPGDWDAGPLMASGTFEITMMEEGEDD